MHVSDAVPACALQPEMLNQGRGMVCMHYVKKCCAGTHCLFSASFAAFKSLKYCVIAFAAALCSMMVGPLFAGLHLARSGHMDCNALR